MISPRQTETAPLPAPFRVPADRAHSGLALTGATRSGTAGCTRSTHQAMSQPSGTFDLNQGQRFSFHPRPPRVKTGSGGRRFHSTLKTDIRRGAGASTAGVGPLIYAMHLKDRLGDIETDCRNRLHRWLLRIMGASNGAHILGTLVPVEEPSTASQAEVTPLQP